ncbi:MAG: DUF898 family protein [Inquilinus sp.]|nr:DUF898 family protein [Inquilinus sp.]
MTNDATPNPQGALGRTAAAIRFEPSRLALLLLVLKGWALTVLTLGAYRFRARAQRRAFFWQHTALAGERFEYDAASGDLFRAFLAQCAFAGPLALLVLGLLAFRSSLPLPALLGAMAVAGLAAVFVYHLGVFRDRRLLIGHTVWRGIHGGLDGSPVAYAAMATAGWLGTVASLGLAHPWLRQAAVRFVLNRARFGDRAVACEPAAGPPVAAWLSVWLGGVVTLALFAVVNLEFLTLWFDGLRAASDGAMAGPTPNLLPLAALAVPALLHVHYRVRAFGHLVNAVTLGRSALSCDLPTGALVGAVLAYWLALAAVLAAALLALHAGALEAATRAEPLGWLPIVAAGLAVLAVRVVLRRVWLQVWLARLVTRRLVLDDVPALASVEHPGASLGPRLRRGAAGSQLAAEEA